MGDHLGQADILAELQAAHGIAANVDVRDKLAADIQQTERAAHLALRVGDPYYPHRNIFQESQSSLQRGETSPQLMMRDIKAFCQLCAADGGNMPDRTYWATRIRKLRALHKNSPTSQTLSEELAKEQKTTHALLQERWGKALDKAQAQWRLNAITELRQQLMTRLTEWLKQLQQITEALDDFAFAPGLLFDLSRDNLTLSDIEEMKKWAKYLTEDEEMQRLLSLLGRMQREDHSKRREWIESVKTFSEVRPDIHSREEFSGVRLGNSIEHALPQEKALLADADTALLFDIKFVEGRLMEFDTAGWAQHETERTAQQEVEVSEEDKKGPLIVCVDTSGSMQGMPETIAKAVALYLATAARQQKRECFLINFSTDIETLDLSQSGGMHALIHFLQKSFSGGTDVAPALKHAVQTMQTEDYKKADLLVVSDFVMSALPKELPPLIAAAKENDNRFFSLIISGGADKHALENIFDCEWHYQPGSGARQLVDIAATISDKPYA